tara:strand:- start:503 stop:796 length:294 start_codon:yes stop_codon:yes gene_type:complete
MDVLGHSRILVTLPLPEDILIHIDSYNDKQLQRVVYDNFGKICDEWGSIGIKPYSSNLIACYLGNILRITEDTYGTKILNWFIRRFKLERYGWKLME